MPLATATSRSIGRYACPVSRLARWPAQRSPPIWRSTVDRDTYCGSHVHENAQMLQFQPHHFVQDAGGRAARTDAVAFRTTAAFTKLTTVLALSRDSSSDEALPKLRSAHSS